MEKSVADIVSKAIMHPMGCQGAEPLTHMDFPTRNASIRAIVAAFCITAASAQAMAAEPPPSSSCPICSRANNQSSPYHEKAATTLIRGMTNTTFGWTELLTQPSAEVERGGNLATGIGRGVGAAVKRTAVGIGELFTFWVPKGTEGYPILVEDCPICALPTQAKPASATATTTKTAPASASAGSSAPKNSSSSKPSTSSATKPSSRSN